MTLYIGFKMIMKPATGRPFGALPVQLPPKVTTRAFERLAEIGAADQGQALRVAVEGGGCALGSLWMAIARSPVPLAWLTK